MEGGDIMKETDSKVINEMLDNLLPDDPIYKDIVDKIKEERKENRNNKHDKFNDPDGYIKGV